MTITSWDGVTNAFGVGKTRRHRFQKVTSNAAASVAGRWHELFTASGFPSAGAFSGTAGVATVMNSSTAGAIELGANVSPDVRHLASLVAQSPSSTLVPATLRLVDFLLYYPACVVTGTPTALNNTATLPRYTTGEGVSCYIAVQTALGAAQPALTLTYTDQAGNAGNVALAMTAPGVSAPVSTLLLAQGGAGGPDLPLAAGDSGVRSIQSYTIATGTTGTVAFILAKELAEIPIGAINSPSLLNTITEMPAMEQVQDGACLGLVLSCGGAMAASSIVMGNARTIWG